MLQKETILNLLPKHFPQLAERGLQEEIAEVGQIMHFSEGEVIMDFNSYVKIVPLIIEGSIKVTREDDQEGREMILYFLNAGETCSMSFTCCMMNKRSEIRTEALEDTTIIGIPVKYVDKWMTQYQSWKNFVMLTYDKKMAELVRVLDNVVFTSLDDRLLKYLEDRAESSKSNTIKSTHQEIATDLNASREAISRLLKKMENTGMVKLRRNEIEILTN
ncbi:MAG: Crp/Fnr family transcriptional regulator [Saprospiraceae bacterium]|nr:Crp/Fnr family transcriptional regulator [Saprospiraceae bacterium]